MANCAHLVRRQSSRDLNPQRSLDRLELKDMKNRLMLENGNFSYKKKSYGTTNTKSEESEKTSTNVRKIKNCFESMI